MGVVSKKNKYILLYNTHKGKYQSTDNIKIGIKRVNYDRKNEDVNG